jgi:nucleoid-associated protein YgaU
MGLWTTIKDVLTKSPLDEARDQRRAEPAEASPTPDDVPEMPQSGPAADTTAPPTAPAPPVDEPAAPAAPVEPEYRTYTVKPGDTLSAIGMEYGVDWHDIAKLNDLENPDLIFPGQVFKIPNN